METIGSAERSTSVEDMRHGFNTISNGMYAKTLYSKFSKERVNKNRFINKGDNFILKYGI